MSRSQKSRRGRLISSLRGEITPDRWTGEAAKNFRPGQNPWLDIFDDAAAKSIAKIIRVEDEDGIHSLRLNLAATAEYLISFLDFVGGRETPRQKRGWIGKVHNSARRLLEHLADREDFFLSAARLTPERNSVAIMPASELRRRIESVEEALADLLELTEWYVGSPDEAGTDPPRDGEEGAKASETDQNNTQTDEVSDETAKAQTVQKVVDGMTEVFIDVRGRANVKRIVSSPGVYGEFPDFIRESAGHFLRACYLDYRKNSQKNEMLNRQIQRTVSKYS